MANKPTTGDTYIALYRTNCKVRVATVQETTVSFRVLQDDELPEAVDQTVEMNISTFLHYYSQS